MDTIHVTRDTVFEIDLSWIPAPEEIAGKLDSISFHKSSGSEAFHLQKINRSEQYWPFFTVFTLLCLFAFIRINYHNKFRNLTNAFVNVRYMKQLLREELVLTHPFSLFLILQFSIGAGFLIYSWSEYLGAENFSYSGWKLFLYSSVAVLLFLTAKTAGTLLIQFVTGEDYGQTENRYNILLFNQLCGVILLPFIVLTQFGPDELFKPSLFTGTFIIAGVYVYRLFRSFLVGVTSGNTSFHLFIYLCTLEIIPLIVLIRLLVTKIG